MKMFMQHLPWCALMLLACAIDPGGDGPADPPGESSSTGGVGGAAGSSGTPGTPVGGSGNSDNSGTPGAAGTMGAPPAGAGGTTAIPNTSCGAPPTVSLMSPAAAAQVAAAPLPLQANMVSSGGAATSVTFYMRRAHDPDFTVIVMPDTQNYTVDPWNQQHFDKQTAWTMERRVPDNIVAVIHNGDIICNWDIKQQWDWAEKAMATLEQPLPEHPAGLPYIVAIGNHDQEPMGVVGSANEFNRRFGVQRFTGRPYYGGHFGDRNDHSYITFTAGSQKFLVLTFEYGTVPAAAQAWGLEVIRSHPDHRVILDVHELINANGSWAGAGESIYQLIKAEPNVELMTAGHNIGEGRRSDTFEGHTVHTIFANWQHLDQGGLGRLRIWRFSPANGTLHVRSYSPSFDEEFTADESRFTLPFDMSNAVPEFAPVAVVGDVTGQASTMTGTLEAGTEYEWFVETKDACGQITASEVRKFSTL